MSISMAVSTAALLRPTARSLVVVAAAVVAATLLGASAVQATTTAPQTYVVTRTDDPAPNKCVPTDCSLREAVVSANRHPGSTIVLGAATYVLTIPGADNAVTSEKIGDLDIRVQVTIRGAGGAKTFVQSGPTPGSGIHRIFDVSARSNVLITNLTIQNGREVEGGTGGCIRNIGMLTLDAVVVRGCSSPVGGGGISSYGILTIRNSVITGNWASSPSGGHANGGGVAGGPGVTFSPGTVTISNSTISNNRVTSGGNKDLYALGGGFANTATMNLTDSLVIGNSALNAGGGISVGNMTITRSTFSGNTSRYDVGAVDNDVHMTINDSTFTDNHAGVGCVGSECGRAYAGGILNTAGGTMYLNNSTVSGNTCKVSGGGVLNALGTLYVSSTTIAGNTCGVGGGLSASDKTFIRNTIIGANTPTSTDPPGFQCSGILTSQGYNLIEDTRCRLDGDMTGNVMGKDPQVGQLQSNGGPTQTRALGPYSPAIDGGDPTGCRSGAGAMLATDQRGSARSSGGRCDIGAYERP